MRADNANATSYSSLLVNLPKLLLIKASGFSAFQITKRSFLSRKTKANSFHRKKKNSPKHKNVRRRRRSSSARVRQRYRHVQGWFRRRRRSKSRLPIHRRQDQIPRCHGWHGPKGRLRRRRGPIQARHPQLEVPAGARHCHQLGRYGEGNSYFILFHFFFYFLLSFYSLFVSLMSLVFLLFSLVVFSITVLTPLFIF
jgi:hypothetical protein